MGEYKYKVFLEKILKSNYTSNFNYDSGVFDKFYTPFLGWMEYKILDLLEEKSEKIKFDIESICKSILCSTKEGLIEICLKTLITEFYNFKAKEIDQNINGEYYKTYNKRFEEIKNIGEILNKYEGLSYLIYQRLSRQYNLLDEVINHLIDDIDLIRNKFKKNLQSLCSIRMNSGDSHNDGKSVMILNFNSEEKIVYKPHCL